VESTVPRVDTKPGDELWNCRIGQSRGDLEKEPDGTQSDSEGAPKKITGELVPIVLKAFVFAAGNRGKPEEIKKSFSYFGEVKRKRPATGKRMQQKRIMKIMGGLRTGAVSQTESKRRERLKTLLGDPHKLEKKKKDRHLNTF